MSTDVKWNGPAEFDEDVEQEEDPTDFTSYVDPSPVALDAHSPMDLVYEMFVVSSLPRNSINLVTNHVSRNWACDIFA